MAKKNRNSNANSNVNVNVVTTTPVQEDTMANQTFSASEELARRIEAKKQEMARKDYKKSELAKLTDAKNKEIKALRELAKDDCKDLDDSYEIAGINHLYDGYILEVEAKYAPAIKALKLDLEVAGEALGTTGGEKIGAVIAPVTKTVGSFFGTLAKRAGLPTLGK